MEQRLEARHTLRRLVSGGQTGVDRAVLDVALAVGFPVGGWCPKGRRAEDGPLPARYPLRETPSADYAQRTAWNVRDSDATLVLLWGRPTGGTAWTLTTAEEQGRPTFIHRLSVTGDEEEVALESLQAWLAARGVAVLNVAGPRESEAPGVYAAAYRFVASLVERIASSSG